MIIHFWKTVIGLNPARNSIFHPGKESDLGCYKPGDQQENHPADSCSSVVPGIVFNPGNTLGLFHKNIIFW